MVLVKEAEVTKLTNNEIMILMDEGNRYKSKKQYADAIKTYNYAFKRSSSNIYKSLLILHLINTHVEQKDDQKTETFLQKMHNMCNKVPSESPLTYDEINEVYCREKSKQEEQKENVTPQVNQCSVSQAKKSDKRSILD
jgi:tetratricopeptide (TPR) repeat protein